ncbi:MAG: hypothetical protein JW940_12625 [Polyangiaceae bacterium]|nr:hypothetical protein [Polyangiaceae bacterium]
MPTPDRQTPAASESVDVPPADAPTPERDPLCRDFELRTFDDERWVSAGDKTKAALCFGLTLPREVVDTLECITLGSTTQCGSFDDTKRNREGYVPLVVQYFVRWAADQGGIVYYADPPRPVQYKDARRAGMVFKLQGSGEYSVRWDTGEEGLCTYSWKRISPWSEAHRQRVTLCVVPSSTEQLVPLGTHEGR